MPPAELVGWLQLAAIVLGLGGVLIRVGGRDATLKSNTAALEELGKIVQDLVKYQVASEVNHSHFREVLSDIKDRLHRLETHRLGSKAAPKE